MGWGPLACGCVRHSGNPCQLKSLPLQLEGLNHKALTVVWFSHATLLNSSSWLPSPLLRSAHHCGSDAKLQPERTGSQCLLPPPTTTSAPEGCSQSQRGSVGSYRPPREDMITFRTEAFVPRTAVFLQTTLLLAHNGSKRLSSSTQEAKEEMCGKRSPCKQE